MINLDPLDTYEAKFVRDLAALLRKKKLSLEKLKELARNEAQLSQLLLGRLPSKPFLENIIGCIAPKELPAWRKRWTAAVQTPRAVHPPTPARRARPGETDAVSALIWAWVCAALAVVLAYTVTATLTAGIQAHPGASILNLIIYIVLALLGLLVATFLLATPILMKPKSDKPFFFSLVAYPAALPAGLLIPWLAAVNQPWEWLADHLGVI